MVSQIERGESNPTISTLWNLTKALQVDFAGLLEDAESAERIKVLRNSDVPAITNTGKQCTIRILSPPEEAGGYEVYDIEFLAGGSLTSQPHARGAQEQLTVLEGAVQVVSGNAEETLRQGDTGQYAADVPHAISASDQGARVFLIVKSA